MLSCCLLGPLCVTSRVRACKSSALALLRLSSGLIPLFTHSSLASVMMPSPRQTLCQGLVKRCRAHTARAGWSMCGLQDRERRMAKPDYTMSYIAQATKKEK
jgi:hypothetical protein